PHGYEDRYRKSQSARHEVAPPSGPGPSQADRQARTTEVRRRRLPASLADMFAAERRTVNLPADAPIQDATIFRVERLGDPQALPAWLYRGDRANRRPRTQYAAPLICGVV